MNMTKVCRLAVLGDQLLQLLHYRRIFIRTFVPDHLEVAAQHFDFPCRGLELDVLDLIVKRNQVAQLLGAGSLVFALLDENADQPSDLPTVAVRGDDLAFGFRRT